MIARAQVTGVSNWQCKMITQKLGDNGETFPRFWSVMIMTKFYSLTSTSAGRSQERFPLLLGDQPLRYKLGRKCFKTKRDYCESSDKLQMNYRYPRFHCPIVPSSDIFIFSKAEGSLLNYNLIGFWNYWEIQ